VAADGREARLRVERVELGGEPLTVHHVVGIHARDHPPVAVLEAGGQRRHQAPVPRRHDAEAPVARREALRDGACLVRRAVVHDDALPAWLALPRDAAQAGVERRLRVVGREQDRDLGRAQRVNSRKY